MEKRRGKKKILLVHSQENDAFVKKLCNQYEILKKRLQDQKEYARESMKQAVESLKCQIPPEVLNTKLKDFPTTDSDSLSKFIGTPKVSNLSSAGILRIPEPGEYAVTATGTPLLVLSGATDTVNINILLRNGQRIAILPNADVNPDAICDNLAPDVKTQLNQLTDTLTKILEDDIIVKK